VSQAGTTTIAALVAPLLREPSSSAIFSDLDGTLAPIVAEPASASVPAETIEVLAALAERYPLVACVTGRRALEARRMVGLDTLVYAGNHGLELLEPRASEPRPAPALGDGAGEASAFIAGLDGAELAADGLRLEDKGPIQAVHWRGAEDASRARGAAERIAGDSEAAGLTPRWGRQVLELRPAVPVDKGSAVRDLVAEHGVELALFGGDDLTDLDAFDALADMVSAGALRACVRVGVDSSEAPPDIGERSDAVVDGPAGFLEVLRLLAGEG
jgi:trehalose 6-phosphate phosphatase